MAAYDIVQLKLLEHDVGIGEHNSLVMIDTTHFILAYAGTGDDGYIKTFSIDGNYDITEIDSLEHDGANGEENSLVKIDATHFILAYRGSGEDGFIKTFSIDGSYDNITQIASLEHDATYGLENSLVMIDTTHFALAYRGTSGLDGFIKTFSIDGSYGTITEIDHLEHDTTTGLNSSLVKIDATHLILAYAGTSGYDGFIKTFSIDANCDNITQIEYLEHDTANGRHNSLVMIDTTHFILAYRGGASYYGYIKTFSIDGSHAITEIDSLEYDTSAGTSNSLIMIDSTHFALAYTGTDLDGYIKVFSIDASYDTITQVSSLEYDTSDGNYNSLVMIDSGHLILAYAGVDGDGFIKTFSIETVAPDPPADPLPVYAGFIDDVTGVQTLGARSMIIHDTDWSGAIAAGDQVVEKNIKLGGYLRFSSEALVVTPLAGTIEYNGDKFYITNGAKQKVIDRTSDVAVATVTVASTAVETTLWTGSMPADCLDAGNVFKFHCDGLVSNGGATADDEVTIRIKIGGVTKVTLNPNLKALTDVDWHLDVNGTQRTLTDGATLGTRAVHAHMQMGDPASTGDEVGLTAVVDIDTEASMDVTVTAQWASSDASNTISLYQGYMEYKN